MRAAALLLFGLAATASGEPSDEPPRHAYSLIVAIWPVDMPTPPCAGEVICDVMVGKVQFPHVTTLAGPRVPEPLTLYLGWHGMLPRGERFSAAVWREKGVWHAHWVPDFRPDNCVSADTLSDYRIRVPREAYRKGTAICFPT
jgi:hypothetical protein